MDVSGEEEADTTPDLSSSRAWSGSILFVIPPMATQPDSNHSAKSLREEKNNNNKKEGSGGGEEMGVWGPATCSHADAAARTGTLGRKS